MKRLTQLTSAIVISTVMTTSVMAQTVVSAAADMSF